MTRSNAVLTECIAKDGLGGERHVEIRGPDADAVSVVEATALALAPEAATAKARDLFGRLAGLEHAGAEPARARAWMRASVGKSAGTRIGALDLETFANVPTALMPRIEIPRPGGEP